MRSEDILKIGLTGGMGCGKSTVLQMFADLKFGVVSSDEIVRRLLTEDVEVIQQVIKTFGDEVKNSSNGIDRSALGRLVFTNPDQLRILEGILHPLVRQRWQNEVNKGRFPYYIVEIPLLFEKNLEKLFDFSVCVSVDSDIQLQRLQDKGISREDAESRISRQLPLVDKVQRADFVISNNGSIEHLKSQVLNLASQFRSISAIA